MNSGWVGTSSFRLKARELRPGLTVKKESCFKVFRRKASERNRSPPEGMGLLCRGNFLGEVGLNGP